MIFENNWGFPELRAMFSGSVLRNNCLTTKRSGEQENFVKFAKKFVLIGEWQGGFYWTLR